VHDARPDGERDQAAMLGRITRGSNEIDAEDRVDPTDHLQVVLALTAVPLPSRRPNEAKRVDGEEDYADCNEGNLEEFFARDVVHADPLFVTGPGLVRLEYTPLIRSRQSPVRRWG